MAGICAYGGYVPRYRLNRMKIYQAMGWMNPGNIGNARGEKAVANFDEDSITMAVAAGVDALRGFGSLGGGGDLFCIHHHALQGAIERRHRLRGTGS